jgi:hypothetical protein
LLSIIGETAASPRLRVIIIQELIIQKSYVGWVVLIARWDIKIRGPEICFVHQTPPFYGVIKFWVGSKRNEM